MERTEQFPIGLIRATDSYVNATLMCKSGTKQWADYKRLASTTKFIERLAKELGVRKDRLVHGSLPGGNRLCIATWVHPRVATHLAQWISVDFSVKLTSWLEQAKQVIPTVKAECEEALTTLESDGTNQIEREVRQRLLKQVNGQERVNGKYGEIDIVSLEEVIEVKWAPKYAHALGQVLCHSESYPEKGRRVHLFGTEEECDDEKMVHVATLFSKYNITLTFEKLSLD